ncbi:MAG TPA: Gfo/Idh/MocA family oxidoreductase [Tenuifilaceae bacterium]|nr:Gfo/Idh/MocA family oxidoreductase [Tenuifilaceae bacterium]
MKKVINWGIIAPGRIARKFASDLKLVDNANLLAVASREINKAKEFAHEFDAQRSYGSYVELANDPDVDVVYVASPHVFHYEHSLLCLHKGKHVLCEKPMGMNAQQVKELAMVADQRNLFLMEAFWTNFIPSFVKCREIVANGVIGDIKVIQADFGFKANYDVNARTFNKELGGGSLLDIGLYPVFLALELAGEPDQIKASAIIGSTGVDETCSMVFNYQKKGIIANLSSSFLVSTPTEALIYGTLGTIKMHTQWHAPTSISIIKDGKEDTLTFNEPGFGYEYEIQEVVSCLLSNLKESSGFPLSKSILLHQTLDRVRAEIDLSYKFD